MMSKKRPDLEEWTEEKADELRRVQYRQALDKFE